MVHVGNHHDVVSLGHDSLTLESRLSQLKREEDSCELAAIARHLGLHLGEEGADLILTVPKRALSPPPPAPTKIGCLVVSTWE